MLRSNFKVHWDKYRIWKRATISKTEIEEMVLEFPDKNWNWKELSYNRSVSFGIYLKFPDKDWTWLGLSTKVTGKLLTDYPTLPWVWDVVAAHVEIGFVESHPEFPWNYWLVSRRDDLSAEFVEKNLDLPWDWDVIAQKTNLDLNFISKIRERVHIGCISCRDDLTPEFVDSHPDWGWDMGILSKNVKFPISWFEDKMYSPTESVQSAYWVERLKPKHNFREASTSSTFLYWEFDGMFKDSDNFEEFVKMTEEGCDIQRAVWAWFSSKNSITLDFVLRHKNKPWNWIFLSGNSIITEKFILDNPDLPWVWEWVWCVNPNTGYDFALKYQDLIGRHMWGSDKITLDFLRLFPVEKISFQVLSWNMCVTAEIYRYYSDQEWDYAGLSTNSCLDSGSYLFNSFQKDCASRRECISALLNEHPTVYHLRNLIVEYVDWE
jgi:hypothetical protein